MSVLLLLSVVAIVLLVGTLAFFLAWVGQLLRNIATNLDDANNSVKTIISHAELIKPGVDHINHTGGVVSGALPLLYGHAERLAAQQQPAAPAAARPKGDGPVRREGEQAPAAVARRRSRLTETVGYRPPR